MTGSPYYQVWRSLTAADSTRSVRQEFREGRA